MKYLFSLALLFWMVPVWGQAISGFSDFENLYTNIYQQTNQVDVGVLYERLCQYPEIDCNDDLEIKSLSDILKGATIKSSGEKLAQDRIRQYLGQQLLFEKNLLDFERSLQQLNSLQLSLYDGNQGNSAFDGLAGLEKLDVLFFGEKAVQFRPAFIAKQAFDDSTSSEPWLDQQESELPEVSVFSEDDPSFGGLVQQLVTTFSEQVNPFSLLCTKNTKNIFDYPFCTEALPTPKTGVASFSLPDVSQDTPESQTVVDTGFDTSFDGYLQSVLNQSLCNTQSGAVAGRLKGGLSNIEACQHQRTVEHQAALARFQKSVLTFDVNARGVAYGNTLAKIKGMLEFFDEFLDSFESRWESISNHPKK